MTCDRQRLFGAMILMASICAIVWMGARMSPLPDATLGDWLALTALSLSAAIGGVICNLSNS